MNATKERELEREVQHLTEWLKAKPEAVFAIIAMAKGYGFKPAKDEATRKG